ncbi:MAG: response regulator [Verrucomicrobia bacterium]|nr:response regulator [Verrucomicrobiota bacterium]
MKKVMVIDDDASISRLLKWTLEQTGRYTVREENDACCALVCAREFQPDLILTDVMMPRLSGGDLAHQLRQDSDFRDTPILFLTAAVRKEELGGAWGRVGGRLFIAKPVNSREVMSLIDDILEPGNNRARHP